MWSGWNYLTRASGLVATVLLVLALAGGLFFSARATGRRRRPNWWLDLHNYLGGLAFAFVVVHVVASYLDRLSGIGLVQVFVPMTAAGWAWGITWGVLSMYVFAAVVFTSWPRKRLSRRNWLIVHLASIPATFMAAAHAWMVGSSRHGLWFHVLLALLAGLAVYPAVLRLAGVMAKRRARAARTAPLAAPVAPPLTSRAPMAPSGDAVSSGGSFRRVEHHMSTAVTLAGRGIDDVTADAFFDRIRHLEDVLSRFRPDSDLSRFARRELDLDRADPALRMVVARCEALRELTAGDFDHEPHRRSDDPRLPRLDVDAVAKGWIIDDAARVLRTAATEFLVNAGGDITASARPGGACWRVGIQHPADREAILGTFEVARGAVATSGTYERGSHIREHGDAPAAASLTSVTVVGPDLATADGLATAVYASGQSPPDWWRHVEATYGLLTLDTANHLRWLPPTVGADVEWSFPNGARVERSVLH